jgi:hypothetical protein
VADRLDELLERAQQMLSRDPRVKSVELAGSRAEGTADEWSDLDIGVVTYADGYESFLGEWPRWLAEITPTVFARTPIAPFLINTITADGDTFDIAVHRGELMTWPPPKYSVGLLSSVRYDEIGPALEYAVAEQMRGLAGPFISLLQREEHVRHVTGVAHLLGLLTTVFLAETGSAPLGKHWNRTLTDEQRAAVAALPPLRATREDVMVFGLALAELLVTRARPLFPRHGLVWPGDLAAVTARRLLDSLDVDTSSWLF